MSAAPQQFIYTEELYSLSPKVIVLIPVPWETLPEEHVALLSKILASIRLSLAGVQILCREKAMLSELEVFNPSAVISFGTALTPVSELYTLSRAGSIRIVQSAALGSLDDVSKKSLWNALKQAFA